MSDEPLIAGLLAGDREVVELARTWIRSCFAPYRGRLASEQEDLEQEILLELTRALRDGRFQRRSSLRTYVHTYVHHKCIDRVRSLQRRDWVDIDSLGLASQAPSALDKLSRRESVELALRVLETMPESCRELWRMLQEGIRYQEMSRRLGIAEGALRARVLRCRRRALKVRQELLSASRRNKGPGPSTR